MIWFFLGLSDSESAVAPRGMHRAGCRALTSRRMNATNLDAGELELGSQSDEKEK